jgi:phage repressor protein C with HTH and peptisase S24 domain
MENQTLGSRIRTARKKAGLTQAEVGRVFDISREAVSLWENDTNAPTADKLGRIALETHVNSEWLISGRGEMEGQAPSMVSMPFDVEAAASETKDLGQIPVIGMGAGGSDGHYEWNGEEIDRVDRPEFLAGVAGAYALYVSGTSMVPRYEDGELLFVNPGRSIVPESYVVVQFHRQAGEEGTPCVWIKQFVKRGQKETVFRQLNPPKELKIPTKQIVAVHRVVGTRER